MTDRLRVFEEDATCAFCGRGNDEAGSMIRSNITSNFVCAGCGETIHLIFARVGQLEVAAKAASDKKIGEGEIKNEDGSCNCPSCTFNRMFSDDAVVKSLMTAEEITTRH